MTKTTLLAACMVVACSGGRDESQAQVGPSQPASSAPSTQAPPANPDPSDNNPPEDPPGEGEGCDGCLADSLVWSFNDEGRAPSQITVTLSSCRALVHQDLHRGSERVLDDRCSGSLICGGGPLSVDTVEAALTDPDVVAAFANAPAFYGGAHTVGAPFHTLTLAGNTIQVGLQVPYSKPIPAGVLHLLAVLARADNALVEGTSCSPNHVAGWLNGPFGGEASHQYD